MSSSFPRKHEPFRPTALVEHDPLAEAAVEHAIAGGAAGLVEWWRNDTTPDDRGGERGQVVSYEEIERRRAAFVPPPPQFERGYGRLYIDHVQQADKGVDFDFLVGGSGTPPSKVSF